MKFGLRMLRLRCLLRRSKAAPIPVPACVDPKEVFCSASFEDLWLDANMPEVAQYLKGSCDLEIPPEWRALLPVSL